MALAADFRHLPLVVSSAQEAESAGFDGVALSDHPYAQWQPDTWTVLTHLAAVTDTIKLSPNVIHLPARDPVVLAKSAATFDRFAGGRLALGLGAGDRRYHDAMRSMGLPTANPGEALQALREAVAVLQLVWSGDESVSFDGLHYRLSEFRGGLPPAHHVDILLGALGPKALALTGEVADGWSISRIAVDEVRAKRRILDDAAAATGRDPAAITTRYNLLGRITENGPAAGRFDGPPEHWVEALTELAVDASVDTFLIHFVDQRADTEFQDVTEQHDTAHQYRLFAEQVIPAVRAAVSNQGEDRQ